MSIYFATQLGACWWGELLCYLILWGGWGVVIEWVTFSLDRSVNKLGIILMQDCIQSICLSDRSKKLFYKTFFSCGNPLGIPLLRPSNALIHFYYTHMLIFDNIVDGATWSSLVRVKLPRKIMLFHFLPNLRLLFHFSTEKILAAARFEPPTSWSPVLSADC